MSSHDETLAPLLSIGPLEGAPKTAGHATCVQVSHQFERSGIRHRELPRRAVTTRLRCPSFPSIHERVPKATWSDAHAAPHRGPPRRPRSPDEHIGTEPQRSSSHANPSSGTEKHPRQSSPPSRSATAPASLLGTPRRAKARSGAGSGRGVAKWSTACLSPPGIARAR